MLDDNQRALLGSVLFGGLLVARARTLGSRRRAKTPLLYLSRPSEGKRTGRNIGVHSNCADDLEANHVAVDVEMSNWRNVSDPPSLRDDNFTLRKIRAVESNADFADADYLKRFYKRVENDVREAVGCDRVVVFDHTLRVSGVEGLNSLDGKSAAGAVIRVHGDYTTVSGPIRLQKLLDEGAVDRKPSKRFAFVNTWQSIDNDHPILSHPLALCRPRSLDYSKNTWQYYMHYESRVGQNLAVEGRQDQHEWGYYPKMTTDEAILFVTYDSAMTMEKVGVVHTAFDDASIDWTGVPRRSIECRTVAMWD